LRQRTCLEELSPADARHRKKEAGVLIENYDLEVFTPPCEPGAERYAARARLMVDISEILPYLNTTLRGAVYLKEAQALT
jgi:hypothetical protein